MTENPAGEGTPRTRGTNGASDVRDRAREWGGPDAVLVLADGETFRGTAFGAEPDDGITVGPFTVTTVMSGYQQVVSNPAHQGEVVVFSYPQIGNVGVNAADDGASPTGCAGVVVRDLSRLTSNWRTEGDFDTYLRERGIAGITGVDTRRLVRHLRDNGPLRGAFGKADHVAVSEAARSADDPLDGPAVEGVGRSTDHAR